MDRRDFVKSMGVIAVVAFLPPKAVEWAGKDPNTECGEMCTCWKCADRIHWQEGWYDIRCTGCGASYGGAPDCLCNGRLERYHGSL